MVLLILLAILHTLLLIRWNSHLLLVRMLTVQLVTSHLLGLLLLTGMSFAGWEHDVEDWWISIIAAAIVYPSLLFFARSQARSYGATSQTEQTLGNLHRVASGVSHSLNNSLMAVSGNLELALDKHDVSPRAP